MTSDAQEKFIPYFVRAKMPGYRGGYVGCLVVIATWVVLYLWGVTQLVDGVLDWLTYGSSSAVVRVAVAVATTTVSTITAEQVQLGTMKYYSLCALGGVLSCGITHTAIVPLDLVKCRIQVGQKSFVFFYQHPFKLAGRLSRLLIRSSSDLS
ncbi:unnamed protein product [Heligmosomoides polygyrus]|uniref:Sulfate_transp domain-containing protein n=1 Tax=Heligmosomoides polygyrus TaxID=6339 RepID=A0A183GSJ4_HELPZ|nr:unnamed protein product [Heligmosomoides polygyrus]